MQEAVASPLAGWESFYVIVGSSSAALTGLMFVVISLVADRRQAWPERGLTAFGTPTVVHFCSAFLISTILSAPWHAIAKVAIVIGLVGLAGTVYAFIVIRRARQQTHYQAVFEDWLWHTILPLASYLTLVVSAAMLPRRTTAALFAIGTMAVLLLFIGIHNSWDAVTYTVSKVPKASGAKPNHPDDG